MDTMTAVLLFMLFFFLGFVAMFYHLLRRLDSQCQLLSDEHAQLRVLLRAMESRIDRLERHSKSTDTQSEIPSAAKMASENVSAGHDPLLHLSFEKPTSPEININRGLPDLHHEPDTSLTMGDADLVATGKNV